MLILKYCSETFELDLRSGSMSKRTILKIEGIVFVVATLLNFCLPIVLYPFVFYQSKNIYHLLIVWIIYCVILFMYFYNFTIDDNSFGEFTFKNLRKLHIFAGSRDNETRNLYLDYYKNKKHKEHPINCTRNSDNPKSFCRCVEILESILYRYENSNKLKNDIVTKILDNCFYLPNDTIKEIYDTACDYVRDKPWDLKSETAENYLYLACSHVHRKLIEEYYGYIKHYHHDYDELIKYGFKYLNNSEMVEKIAVTLYADVYLKKDYKDYENFSDYINDYGEVKEEARKIFENYKKSYKDELNK